MIGFICFSLSNVLWVIWGVHAAAYALSRPADLSFPDEPSRAQKKLERKGKRAISGLTVTIEILFKTSSVHSQQ
jgi:hypothetical protein